MYTTVVDVFHYLIKYMRGTWCGSMPLDCPTMDIYSCVLLNDIVSIALKTINSVENDYQLDGWLMDRDFLDGKWSRTFILLRHMSRLEEWLLCHSVMWVTYPTSCIINQMEYGFKMWCNWWHWWWWWCSWSSHEIVYTTMLMLPGERYVCAQDHYL